MQDAVFKEIKDKMFNYESGNWNYDEKADLFMHPTRTFAYGSLSKEMKNNLEEINLEEIFLKKPKPDWLYYAFRECDLLILNSFLTFVKAFVFKTPDEHEVYPLVFQLLNGKHIFIAPLHAMGGIATYMGTPAWLMTDSMLFDVKESNQSSTTEKEE